MRSMNAKAKRDSQPVLATLSLLILFVKSIPLSASLALLTLKSGINRESVR
jgi:hypothetical protein